MKALVFDTKKQQWENSRGFLLADVPKPELDEQKNPRDANFVLIKVHYAGICGTDRGIWNRQVFRDQILGSIAAENFASGPPPGPPAPNSAMDSQSESKPKLKKTYRILGHEFFGEIAQAGSRVSRQFGLKPGDMVSCESHVVCNQCYQCLRGEKHVCTNEKILGISHDGGFAEYAKVPAHIVWKTDTGKIRPEVAAMQEPFGNAVHAASKVDLKGKSVAIFGLGPIGMFLTLVIKGMDASSIIGVEPNPIAREMAKKLGIDYVIPLKSAAVVGDGIKGADDIKSEQQKDKTAEPPGLQKDSYRHNADITDEIMKITKGVGVDVSFDMAGFNSSVNNCLFATRRGGDIILFGIKQGDFVFEDFNRLIVRGFTLHAVIGRQLWQTWKTTRKLLEHTGNRIQEKMFNVILNQGQGTVLNIEDYTSEVFEKMMAEHPKILLQF